jgi:hypothetical protein
MTWKKKEWSLHFLSTSSKNWREEEKKENSIIALSKYIKRLIDSNFLTWMYVYIINKWTIAWDNHSYIVQQMHIFPSAFLD